MPEPEFGNLAYIDLREIWQNEATEFTPWLAKNLKALGDTLGMDLELQNREAPVGDFSLDILARDLSRNKDVVIENQLEATNHDHLGKLLTYAAGYDASAIIWVAKEIREEHRQAIDWLNQHTDTAVEFYAVTIGAFRIDNSRPAFEFRAIAFPNEFRRARIQGSDHTETSERREAYRAYFQVLIDQLRQDHHFTAARVAQPQNWYSFRSSVSWATYGHSFARGNRVRAEIFIDADDTDLNKEIFDRLQASHEAIEQDFGEPLTWERLDNRQGSRIASYRDGSIGADDQTLEEIRRWAIDHLLRFKRVFDERLGSVYEAAGGA